MFKAVCENRKMGTVQMFFRGRMDKERHVCTWSYHPTVRRNQICMTWMMLQGTMRSERSQFQDVTYYMIPLYETSRKIKVGVGKRSLVARGYGKGVTIKRQHERFLGGGGTVVVVVT